MKKGVKIGIAVGVVAAVIGISAFSATKGDSGIAVRIEPVIKRDLTSSVNASGWVRPNRRVDVQGDIMGRIVELNVREGQNVRRGDIMLRIDPTQYEAALARAKAGVSEALTREAQARANLLQAQRAYDRLTSMVKTNANLVSQQQLDDAETQVKVQEEMVKAATYGVQQARSGVEEAADRLSKTVIRAPMDGVVTRLNVDEGETAIVGTMNNAGSLLLTVADLAEMEAVVRVDETDMPELQLGDSALLQIDAFPKEKFTGRVTKIAHSAVRSPEQAAQTGAGGQGQSIDYEIVITLDNPPATLRSDLSVSAEIVTATRKQVLAVPIIALTVRDRNAVSSTVKGKDDAKVTADASKNIPSDLNGESTDQEGVFVVRGGKSEFVPVRIGIAGKEHFEVLSGLTEKDSVVAGPYEVIRTLESGKAVRNSMAAPAAAPGVAKSGGAQ
ncbi:MAG TPA: efflux RND transporter periplasmic adaptor subunit [Longimicrobiales bacterium]